MQPKQPSGPTMRIYVRQLNYVLLQNLGIFALENNQIARSVLYNKNCSRAAALSL